MTVTVDGEADRGAAGRSSGAQEPQAWPGRGRGGRLPGGRHYDSSPTTLRWEGYAREISRNIQELRKKSGFEISDRIRTTVQAGPALAPVWEQFGDEIAADTLSSELCPGGARPGCFYRGAETG